MRLPLRLLVLSHLTFAAAAPAANPTPSATSSVEARVEETARAHLLAHAERAGLVDPRVEEIDLQVRGRPAATGACPGEIEVEALDTRYITHMRFAAVCSTSPSWRIEYVARGSISAKVVVAAADTAAGQTLDAGDLALERRDVTSAGEAFWDIEQAVGKASRRALRKGQIVARRWLVEPILVKRGAPVSIVARNTGVEVHSPGEALDTGRRGDIVRVRNTRTGRIIRARVVDEGTVDPMDVATSSTSR